MDNLCLPEDSSNSLFTLVVQPQYYNAVQKDPTDRKLLYMHMQLNPVLPVTLEQLIYVPGPHSSSDPGLLAGTAVVVIVLVLVVVCIVVFLIWWR